MTEILESVLNFVFPKETHVRELETLTTEDLQSQLPKAPRRHDATSLFDYRNSKVRSIIWEIKYKKNKHFAFMCAELLSEEILDYVYEKKQIYPQATFLLLPVPTSDKRRRQRGYNQTELVGDLIKKMIPPLRYCTQTLRRDVHRSSQTKKSRAERETNVAGCFSVLNPQHIKNNIVIVFDDVITTGATMDEVCKEIQKHKPKEIVRMTIAH